MQMGGWQSMMTKLKQISRDTLRTNECAASRDRLCHLMLCDRWVIVNAQFRDGLLVLWLGIWLARPLQFSVCLFTDETNENKDQLSWVIIYWLDGKYIWASYYEDQE